MTKAMLMNSARYMTGTGANDTLWSNSQGMGEMNLGDAFNRGAVTPTIFRDELAADTFTATGQTRTFAGTISDSSKPFRITLAWTDAPSAATGSAANINLDLSVTIGGNTYKGNVFSGSNLDDRRYRRIAPTTPRASSSPRASAAPSPSPSPPPTSSPTASPTPAAPSTRTSPSSPTTPPPPPSSPPPARELDQRHRRQRQQQRPHRPRRNLHPGDRPRHQQRQPRRHRRHRHPRLQHGDGLRHLRHLRLPQPPRQRRHSSIALPIRAQRLRVPSLRQPYLPHPPPELRPGHQGHMGSFTLPTGHVGGTGGPYTSSTPVPVAVAIPDNNSTKGIVFSHRLAAAIAFFFFSFFFFLCLVFFFFFILFFCICFFLSLFLIFFFSHLVVSWPSPEPSAISASASTALHAPTPRRHHRRTRLHLVGDLTITLTSPTGTVVPLVSRPTNGDGTASGNNFCSTTLDDSAGTSIQTIGAHRQQPTPAPGPPPHPSPPSMARTPTAPGT